MERKQNAPVRADKNIVNIPVRKNKINDTQVVIQKSNTPVWSIIRKLLKVKQKQKITDNSSTTHGDVDNSNEYDPGFNPCASQTDSYDSDIINEHQTMKQ